MKSSIINQCLVTTSILWLHRTREERPVKVRRVDVGQRVVVQVPAAEAEVEPANGRPGRVDDRHFFVMRPVERLLAAEVVRVAHDGNVLVHLLELMLRVRRRHAHRLADEATRSSECRHISDTSFFEQTHLSDLLVDTDIDLDALLGLSLEQPVEPVFGILGRRPAKVELWAKPPVEDHDARLGLLELEGIRVGVVYQRAELIRMAQGCAP